MSGTARKPKKTPTQTSRKRKILKWVGIGTLVLIVTTLLVGFIGYRMLLRQLPDPGAAPRGRDQTSVVYDRNGKVLAKLYADENRTDRKLDEIPLELQQAVIATEDQRFYEHKGVDPWGVARALWVDITRGKKHGGSTITQQYVKQAFVTSERTLKRKLLEGILAYRIEKKHSKEEILELYLNTIYYGHGAYGVEAASQTYFGKSVTKLNLQECALIGGVIKSPGLYSPYLDAEAARVRRDTVLDQMLSEGYITSEQHDVATATEIEVEGLKESSARAPYFVEWVKAQLADDFGADAIYRGGISVATTLDWNLQKDAEKAVKHALNGAGDPSVALVALDPNTGEVLAMVGGRDFSSQQFNVAVQGRRQPGSAFKPFVLATALEEGILPEQTFESGPASFPLPNGQTWKVTGASGGKKGPMRLRTATEKSVNSVFAQLILDVGASDVVATAEKMGLHSGIDAVPAIALGGLSEGVSPLEMAAAYGTLATGGKRAEPFGIKEVRDADGDVLASVEPSITDSIDPAVAYLTTDILRGVIEHGTGTAAKIGRPAAGKTGTTQEYRDAWFVGYTPQLVCAIWVGYPDAQTEMKDVHGRAVTGGSFPAEIWAEFMKAASEDLPEDDFVKPDGLASVKICTESGGRATEWCKNTASALFLSDHMPTDCTLHTGPTQIKIPNLIGMTKEAALALLKKLMLMFEVTEKDVSGVPAGIVASQKPKSGSVGTTETVVTIVVSNGGSTDMPPFARFSFQPPNPTVAQEVSFDGSSSTDDKVIAMYYWEFGDGTEFEGPTTSHAYAAPGTYDVTLWVTDDAGQTSSISQSITVN